jgi:hypothetical protein
MDETARSVPFSDMIVGPGHYYGSWISSVFSEENPVALNPVDCLPQLVAIAPT